MNLMDNSAKVDKFLSYKFIGILFDIKVKLVFKF